MEAFDENTKTFCELCQNPVSFLNGNDTVSDKCIEVCSNLYLLAKVNNKQVDDPLFELHVKGFDMEQIWQQIDIFNDENIEICSKGSAISLSNQALSLKGAVKKDTTVSFENHDSLEDTSELSEQNELDQSEIVEDDESAFGDSINNENHTSNVFEKSFERTEVDDDFFSLREMELFLEKEEAEGLKTIDDDEINYFNEIPSSDDDNLSNLSSDNESINIELNSPHTNVSARQLKYEDFFPAMPLENEESSQQESNVSENLSKSSFEKQQFQMSKKILQLQQRSLGEPEWQMKGETTANKRPVNSLLEEVLTFDTNERVAPEITDEHTHDLEAIICQRIKDKAWDDVERKIKEITNPQEYKKKIVLDSEKSKLSLQEIYEKEYIAKLSNEEREEKEDPAHVELKSMMSSLFKKLDSLSHFHFHTAPPAPEIKVVTNLPSVAMEEVQPITHTDADFLAPEEIAEKKDIKGREEKTSTDRKRERRKKSTRQKAYHKARLAKLELLANTNEKLKTVRALKQLHQSAKNPSSQTTIIKKSMMTSDKIKTSKSFFSNLEQVKLNANGHLKRNVRTK